MTTASLLEPRGIWAFAATAIVAAFGRVYFHAHHALDVAVGAALAVGNTWLVLQTTFAGTWIGFTGIQVAAFAVFGAMSALQKKRTGKSSEKQS